MDLRQLRGDGCGQRNGCNVGSNLLKMMEAHNAMKTAVIVAQSLVNEPVLRVGWAGVGVGG